MIYMYFNSSFKKVSENTKKSQNILENGSNFFRNYRQNFLKKNNFEKIYVFRTAPGTPFINTFSSIPLSVDDKQSYAL